jgi:hypothetical protein
VLLDRPQNLPKRQQSRLNGSEPMPGTAGLTVLDYWCWAHSNVLENVERAVFAEFVIAAALDISQGYRKAWDGFDLDYGGYKIEVKASAYLQSWEQREHSRIIFQIGARRQLKEDGIAYEEDARYVADAYVFAIFTDRDGMTANVLDVARWQFYVLPIGRLIEAIGDAKSITEQRLGTLTTSVSFSGLREGIDQTRQGHLFVPSRRA